MRNDVFMRSSSVFLTDLTVSSFPTLWQGSYWSRYEYLCAFPSCAPTSADSTRPIPRAFFSVWLTNGVIAWWSTVTAKRFFSASFGAQRRIRFNWASEILMISRFVVVSPLSNLKTSSGSNPPWINRIRSRLRSSSLPKNPSEVCALATIWALACLRRDFKLILQSRAVICWDSLNHFSALSS